MNSKLLDGFTDALARVVADKEREWRKDVERISSEGRAVVAELKAEVARLTVELQAKSEAAARSVEAALALLKNGEPGPPGKDGRDGTDGTPGADGAPGKDGEPGKDGRDGLDGKDGIDGANGKDGRDGKDAVGEKGDPGADGKDGRDGVGVAGAFTDREGHLILTLADGRTQDIGTVAGKDGEPGKDGKDGLDGLGFDDLDERMEDDGRTIVRTYRRGEQIKEFRHVIPSMIYRGVYNAETPYKRGDTVTWAGSTFVALEDTTERPETGKGWQLAVKRGRDGKDGTMKPAREDKPVKVF